MNRTNRIRLVLLAFSFVLIAGCASPDRRNAREATPIRVDVVRPGGSGELALVLPARVTALDDITLTARLSARLTRLDAREGSSFRAGQTLAVFDAPETHGALVAARAGYASAALALDLAKKQEARIDSLHLARVAALRELEGARADLEAARAAEAEARAQLQQMESGVRLTAPFDGVVVRRRIDPGTTVNAGQPVLDLRSRRAGEIAAAVPESELGRLGSGPVEFQIGDGPWLPAELVRVDGMTDYATRSRIARLRPRSPAALDPGAFARVRLSAPAATGGGATASLALPESAIVRRGGLAGVFVVEEGHARMRWLRVGRQGAGRVEVLAGLEEPDLVIANPAGIVDGRAVRVAP
jgi:RND family efflux transporter MFP subunit